jgi:hypothetical protein
MNIAIADVVGQKLISAKELLFGDRSLGSGGGLRSTTHLMTEIGRKVLIYSTWLVLGIVEIGLGAERLVKTWREGAPVWRYALGAVLIVAGVMLASSAGKAAKAQTAPIVRTIRGVTTVLALFILAHVCFPS